MKIRFVDPTSNRFGGSARRGVGLRWSQAQSTPSFNSQSESEAELQADGNAATSTTIHVRCMPDRRQREWNRNPNAVGRKLRKLWRRFGSQIFETSTLIRNGIEDWVKFITLPKQRVRQIQKCVVDWKIENVQFLKASLRRFDEYGCANGPPMTISSPLFTMGKEIGRESTWYLSLRFAEEDPVDDVQFVGAFLALRHSPWAYLNVSFAIHIIDSKTDTIVLTKHMTKVKFSHQRADDNKSKSPDDDKDGAFDENHGIPNFISVQDLSRLLTGTESLEIRLELYLTSATQLRPMECTSCRKIPGRVINPINPIFTRSSNNTRSNSMDIGSASVELEVLAKHHSFYIPVKYFRGFPKLEQYLEEDAKEGSLRILSLSEYSDETVETLLNFLRGEEQVPTTTCPLHLQGSLDKLEEILDICSTYDLYQLARDSWIRFLNTHQLRLENLPRMIVLAHKFKPKSDSSSAGLLKFVTNHLFTLLLIYIWELKSLNSLHYWAAQEPAAFAALFIEDEKPPRQPSRFLARSRNLQSTSLTFPMSRLKSKAEEKTRKIDQFQQEFYSLENMKMESSSSSSNMTNDDDSEQLGPGSRDPDNEFEVNNGETNVDNNELEQEEDEAEDENEIDEDEDDEEEKLVVFIKERLHVDYQAKLSFLQCQ